MRLPLHLPGHHHGKSADGADEDLAHLLHLPGAEQERQRLARDGFEIRDFGEMREGAQRLARARKEAYEAARARAAGKSREEIRGIYLAERRARGLNAPSDGILDAVVERIMTGNPLPAARIAGEGLLRMGKSLNEISKLFRQGQ